MHTRCGAIVACLVFAGLFLLSANGMPTSEGNQGASRLRDRLIIATVAKQRVLQERELSSGLLAVATRPVAALVDNDLNVSSPAIVRRGPILILGLPVGLEEGRWSPRGISPCSCEEGQCGCCTGNLLAQFGINLKQKACMNITYIPEDFEITVNMAINDKILNSNTYSGKNPRPVCVPFPRIPSVKFCVRFSNVYFIGRNFHACLALEGRWQNELVFSRSYDCIRMGRDGVALVKPEDGGGIPAPVNNNEDEDDDDYDDIVLEEEDDDEDDEDNEKPTTNNRKKVKKVKRPTRPKV